MPWQTWQAECAVLWSNMLIRRDTRRFGVCSPRPSSDRFPSESQSRLDPRHVDMDVNLCAAQARSSSGPEPVPNEMKELTGCRLSAMHG